MLAEAVLGATIAVIIILIAAAQAATQAKSNPKQSECQTCPTTTIVDTKIRSDGKTISQTAPATLPPLAQGVSNGQYVNDIDSGGIYYVQNNMLSYISNITALSKMSDYKGVTVKLSGLEVAKMAFGPPILA